MATIMIVEDDAPLSSFVDTAVRETGHRTILCKNGKEAMERFKGSPSEFPRLIICDVMMPGMDGFTLHSLLQQDAATRKIPFIVMTASREMRPLFEVATNLVTFLEKPFDLKTLRAAVDKALSLP